MEWYFSFFFLSFFLLMGGLVEIGDVTIEESVEKVYAVRANRKTRDGKAYVYKNFQVFVRYDFLKTMGVLDHLYLYWDAGVVYVTSVCPDGSVPMKRLSVHKQSGDSVEDSVWKRFFILPKLFFPSTHEGSMVRFVLDRNGFERFSGVHASLTVELV